MKSKKDTAAATEDSQPITTEAAGGLTDEAAEYLAGWKRTQADFDNYRKRTEAAKTEWMAMAAAESALRITPILDDFHRAFAHIPAETQGSAWVTGMRQVEKHLRSALAASGLTPIEDLSSFDPALHEAIAYEEHPELAEGTIIDVVETGWKLGDRVIKPARVRVSKGTSTNV